MEIHSPDTGLTTRRALRAAVLAMLIAPFVLLLLAAGAVFLWENPRLLKWAWIPIPICWLIGFLLLRLLRNRYGAVWQPRSDTLPHWTETDREAWQLVEQFADSTQPATTEQFFTSELYLDNTRQLAEQLAAHYHPNAKDAIENLTIPEILTAAELAISDIRRFVEQNIPGSHLMTVRWLKRAPQATSFWRQIRPVYDAARLIWHPWTVLSRAAAEQTVVNPVMDELKKEGMNGLYRVFVLQLGKYLIELNSHRLRVGPDRWRELMQPERQKADPVALSQQSGKPSDTAHDEPPVQLRIALVGQVKAGKSSLVNALIGHQQAAVDILPLTDTIQQYTTHPPGTDAQLLLLDTVGYAHAGLHADRVDDTMRTICDSAMTILVMKANDPARQPDSDLLQTMESWFAQHPQRRRPPLLVVLTHIDQLSPSLEWSPPYDGWIREHSHRPKERTIHAAVLSVRQLFGHRVDGVVPACSDVDHDRVYGVEEWVVPAILNLLPQATAKQLLDVLYAERDKGRTLQLATQLWNAASTLAQYHFCGIDSVLPEPQPEQGLDAGNDTGSNDTGSNDTSSDNTSDS